MTELDARTRLVAAGYDGMADTWEEWSSSVEGPGGFQWVLTRR